MSQKRNKQTNARKKSYRGITFQSGLEVYMYKQLLKHSVPCKYEGRTIVLDEAFNYPLESFEKFQKGSGEFKNRGGKTVPAFSYTPDFLPPKNRPITWVIEVKGRFMPEFKATWRFFKKWITKYSTINDREVLVFMPRNEKDCDKVIQIMYERGIIKSKSTRRKL